ncbi:DNA-binding transcriptional regulator GbsR (MarR family) [Sinobacterium caligoides]|uniref:HTH-type transcriptional regulator n=1 Tax=Sinobacterium caligoides TaxID=933926 RepID=A0A3N2DKB8_9GAMM|nr:MarR family transcriptional regulator [Sinobacterium caligoides]ROS00250.1 DNA-binding transcriptional regulator GbsR (MarR family) [Sinobacterium caligoides]
MEITPLMERYILHWGEMGTRWGVNRTVSQIHALLYLNVKPMPADEIASLLSVARSNVSTSIKELQSWGLIERSSVLGDRRDHFSAKGDCWHMLLTIVEERKRREIDPILTMLRQCELEMSEDEATPESVKQQIREMSHFVSTLTAWYEQISTLPQATLMKLFAMGAKVARFIPSVSRSSK